MKPEILNGIFVLGGAALGSILTAVFMSIQSRKNRSRSELSIFSESVEPLVEVDSSVSQIVEIRVQGKTVPSIYTLDIRVVNSGNVALHNGTVNVEIEGDATIIAVDSVDSSTATLDALKVQLESGMNAFSADFDFINPSEMFMARALLTARPTRVKPSFRQPNVVTKVETDYKYDASKEIAGIVLEIVRNSFIPHLVLSISFPSYRDYINRSNRNKS